MRSLIKIAIFALSVLSCTKPVQNVTSNKPNKVDTLLFEDSSTYLNVSQYVYLDTSSGVLGSAASISGDSAFNFILPPEMTLYLDAVPTNKATVNYSIDIVGRKVFKVHFKI